MILCDDHNKLGKNLALVFFLEKLHLLFKFSFFFTHQGEVVLGQFWT